MQPLYLNDAYARQFEARVLDVERDRVVLDRTVFCPGEGGQMPDRGWLRWGGSTASVARVDANSGVFWHYMDHNSRLPRVGQTITGELDWTYRHRMMRTHTTFHIASAIAFYMYGARALPNSVLNSGLKIDFRTDLWNGRILADLEQRVNQVIAADVPVLTYFLSRAEARQNPLINRLKVDLLPEWVQQVRVVEIEGVALEVDTGTHIRSTREIGAVQFGKVASFSPTHHQVEVRLAARAPKSLYPASGLAKNHAAPPALPTI